MYRWPAARAEREPHVCLQPTQVLMQRTTPDPRAAALVSLLHAHKSEHRIVDLKEYSLSRMELQATAKEVSESDWAFEAVCQAVEAMMAGVAASITAATSATVA